MKERIWIIIATIAVLIAVVGGAVLALLSGTSPSDAAGIVRSSRYSVIYSGSGMNLPASIKPYVNSVAAGERSNGSALVALVFKDNATSLENQVKSQLEQSSRQLHVKIDGKIVLVTGPITAFNHIPGISG